MTQTQRLKLNKPDAEDFVDISILNENADIIETQVSRIQGEIDTLSHRVTTVTTESERLHQEIGQKEPKTLRVMNLVIAVSEWQNSAEQPEYKKKYIYVHGELREDYFPDLYYQAQSVKHAKEIGADLVITKNGMLEIFAKEEAKENLICHLIVHK